MQKLESLINPYTPMSFLHFLFLYFHIRSFSNGHINDDDDDEMAQPRTHPSNLRTVDQRSQGGAGSVGGTAMSEEEAKKFQASMRAQRR